jgi:hypothetical protein
MPYSIAGLASFGLGTRFDLILGKAQQKRPEISGGGLIAFVVDGNRLKLKLKIVAFEDLIAIEAPHIIHPVASRQNLGTAMLAERHKKEIKPILSICNLLSSPHLGQSIGNSP